MQQSVPNKLNSENNKDEDRSQWYFSNENTFKGPFLKNKISEYIKNGIIKQTDLVWTAQQNRWVRVNEHPEFKLTSLPVAFNQMDDGKFPLIQKDQQISSILHSQKVQNDLFWSYIQEKHKNLNLQNKEDLKNQQIQIRSQSKLAIGVATGFIVSGMISYYAFNYSTIKSINIKSLSVSENFEAQNTINKSKSQFGNKVQLFLHEKNQTPEFIFATNLENLTDIKLQLKGIPDTLIGNYFADYEAQYKVKDGIIDAQSFFNEAKIFYPGEYLMKLICPSCGAGQEIVFEQKILLGVQKNDNYDAQLVQYHHQLRQQAKAELSELTQLTDSLHSQIDALDYGLIPETFKKKWNLQYKGWKGLQIQLQTEIINLNQKNMSGKYFYKNILNQLVVSLKKMSDLEDKTLNYFKNSFSEQNFLEEFFRTRTELMSEFILIKQKITYSEERPLSASGMPKNSD